MNTAMAPSGPRGFTLIELSIVLVIIGLIVGVVLVGQDLIVSASIGKQIKQMQDLETQVNTFRTKYGCLPGDCVNATTIIGATYNANTVYNGNGDGAIRATANGTTTVATDCLSTDPASSPGGVGEPAQLFMQLDAAGLGTYHTDGTGSVVGVGFPSSFINSGAGLIITCTQNSGAVPPTIFRGRNVVLIGMSPSGGWGGRFLYRLGLAGLGVTWLQTSGINLADAQMIDRKIDDELPSSGAVGAFSGCAAGTASYTNPTPATPCYVMLGKNAAF